MRYFGACLIALVVLCSSLLVWSVETECMFDSSRHDSAGSYTPFVTLGLDSSEAWSVIASMYPPIEGMSIVDARRAGRLVDGYLRSRGLALCGHRESHDTVGTPCSYSPGTPLYNLYARTLQRLNDERVIDDRVLLYLLEREPVDWMAENRDHFFFEDRIIPTASVVTDEDVELRRKEFIAEGFSTAATWSQEEIRRSILRTRSGVSLSQIDDQLNVGRGEVMRAFINRVVRPIHLLSSHDSPTFEGELDGLHSYVAARMEGDLDEEIAKAEPLSARNEERPVEPLAVDSAIEQERVSDTPEAGFARAYGGTRFGLGR